MEFVPDQGVNVEFYRDSVESQYQSLQAGHPVYVEKPFIRIAIPGSQNTLIEVPVEENHMKRFPLQWAKFQAGNTTEELAGWKLEAWPAVNTAQVKTLKYMGIHTVEQLAQISDSSVQQVGMGAMELRARARAAVKAAEGNSAVEAQAAENQRLREEMEMLKATVATMMQPKDAEQEVAEEAPTRKKPGPKPKAEAQE